MKIPVLFIAMLLVGCSDTAGDVDVGSSFTSTGQCGTTQGFIYGTVTDASGGAVADPVVWASFEGSTVESDWSDASGAYELNVEGDRVWTLQAEAPDASCTSDTIEVAVLVCMEHGVDFTCL